MHKKQSSLFRTGTAKFILLFSLSYFISGSFGIAFSQSITASLKDPILVQANTLLKQGKGHHAQSVYNAYLTSHPQNPNALLGLANIAERNFDYPQARSYLENALSSNPENVEIIATLGRLYHRWSTNPFGPKENYSARADEHFSQAEAINPAHPLLIAYRGEWHLDQNDLVSAQRSLQQAIRLNPRCVPAFQGLTRYYLRVKDIPRAKDTALHAIELDPENSRSYFQLAQLLAYAEHPDKAIQYALKSEQLDFGRNPERNLFLAQQFEKLGNTTQAIDYFTEVTKDSPNHVGAILRIAQLHEQNGELKESKAFYLKAIANDPSILTNMMNNARSQLRQEQTGPASKQFFKILMLTSASNNPNYKTLREESFSGLASAVYLDFFYQKTNPNLLNQVLKTLEKQAKSNPQLEISLLKARIAKHGFVSPNLKMKLQPLSQSSNALDAGEALFLLGDYAKANATLDTVDGETAQGYLAIGDRLLLMQALVSATSMYQRGLQLKPLAEIKQGIQRIEAKRQLADRRITEGNNHFNKKEYVEAIRPYKDAKKIIPGWEVPLLRLADTYEQLKQRVSAFYAYQEAIEINPSLMDSEGFAKKYKKLEKKTRKIEAKEAKR